MALTSPGVQVTVIDESFYTPAEPGTVPLIVVASGQDKLNGAGTATATGTTKANAGKAFKMTSQRDLTEFFGVPFFEKTASSTPVHGSERNEYGLLAAYSLLGVSNSAFIVRADVNLDELEAQTEEPGANPNNGQWWVNTIATMWGIQEWNGSAPTVSGGQKFTSKTPTVLTDDDYPSKIENNAPKASVGSIGDYAVVMQTAEGDDSFNLNEDLARIYYKSAGNGNLAGGGTAVDAGDWVLLGSKEWKASHPVVSGTAVSGTVAVNFYVNNSLISGSYTMATLAAAIRSASVTGVTAQAINNRLYIYTDGTSQSTGDSAADGNVRLENGTSTWEALGIDAGDWVLLGSKEWKASHPVVSGTAVSGTVSVNFYVNNSLISGSYTMATLAAAIRAASVTGVTAQAINNRLYIYTDGTSQSTGDSAADGNVRLENGTSTWEALGIDAGLYYGPKLQQTPHTSVPTFKRSDNTDSEGGYPTGSIWLKTTEPNNGARWKVQRWQSSTLSWVSYDAPIYATTGAALYYLDRSGGGANISADSLFVQSNAEENGGFDATPETASFRVWRRNILANAATSITSSIIKSGSLTAGAKTFSIEESLKAELALSSAGVVSFTAVGNSTDADAIAAAINAAGFVNIEASVTTISTTQARVVISHKLGGDFRITDGTGNPISNVFAAYDLEDRTGSENLYSLQDIAPGAYASGAGQDYLASGWMPLVASDPRFAAGPDNPTNEPEDGQMWYNPSFADVDIMVHNGNTWVGYRHSTSPYFDANTTRDNYLPKVSASNPYASGVNGTKHGDLWISTADLENFPIIYRYNENLTDVADASERWELIDKSDQTTEDGVLFADARWNTTGTSKSPSSLLDLITNNFLDPDAPDPALYPKGMMLYNLRRSGGNVKKYRNSYIDTTAENPRTSAATLAGGAFISGQGQSMDTYETDRWTTASPNNEDGSGSFGRKAQRAVVVQALKSVVDTSSEIRDEERRNFNLIACPGYPELMSNLVNLNIDRGITAFVVGDTPLRLKDDATSLTNWGTNAELVTDNGDGGIVTYDEYLACFYPNGFTTDLSGSNAVVPASHMMLRTIALSDNVSYPWFAPAGTRRGGITNATAVGYIDSLTGEFQTVALNEGQRDTLYDLKINPIPFFVGVGLVNYGQKTRARNASALDRINVARLVVYLRSQLNKLARPYIFEPNDKITRDEIKQAAESLLLELVGLRAIYDFAVVCDESNNTPSRIDRNELYVDIAIEPVKAVEFIYIPLRVKNTGEI